jgi:hypothetical protein
MSRTYITVVDGNSLSICLYKQEKLFCCQYDITQSSSLAKNCCHWSNNTSMHKTNKLTNWYFTLLLFLFSFSSLLWQLVSYDHKLQIPNLVNRSIVISPPSCLIIDIYIVLLRTQIFIVPSVISRRDLILL